VCRQLRAWSARKSSSSGPPAFLADLAIDP
jgi:hypothetical protein